MNHDRESPRFIGMLFSMVFILVCAMVALETKTKTQPAMQSQARDRMKTQLLERLASETCDEHSQN